MPLPLRDSVTVLFDALLVKEMLALAAPDELGRKVTVNPADCPEASVIGKEIPLRPNSALVLLAPEIVTDDPLAVSVPFKLALAPVTTLPKFSAAGVSCNCPAAAPVPESPIASCGFEALDAIDRVPELVPVAVGVKTTANVTLCPPARVIGRVSPLRANDPLVALAPDSVTFVLPVFFTVSIRVCEVPGVTLPNERVDGDAVIGPVLPPPPEPETPAPNNDAEAEVPYPPFLQRCRPPDVEPLT